MIENPIYFGDGLYGEFTDYHVILSTGSHDHGMANNVVYIELEQMEKFIKWYRECKPDAASKNGI